MRVALPQVELAVFKTRNFIFFAAVIAMNYTLMRPSPVDLIFIMSLLISLFVKQEMTGKFVALLLLLTAWALGYFLASIPFLDEQDVPFELLAKTFSISIALIGAFVAMSWRERHFEIFMKVYIASCVIASILGTIGFVLQSGLLTWDDRAKGLIDDPNMYGSFLLPAVLFCVHLLHFRRGNRLLLTIALPILTLGVLLSFSRIATVALIVCTFAYVLYLHRLHIWRLVPVLVGLIIFALVLFAIAYFSSQEFSEKFLQRLSFAQSYDLGREGRYGRFLLVLPMILDNPMGFGVLQLEKIFPEPIHNIWLSSFVNYGWLGGFTWIVLFFASIAVTIQNYRRTRSPIVVVMLLSLVSIVMCASLHEGEHWRHMWLVYGMVWGFNPRNFGTARSESQSVVSTLPHRIFHAGGIERARPRRANSPQ